MAELPENFDIRILMFKLNIKQFQVAKHLKIHPATLCVWLNRRLKKDEKEKIMMAIEDLKESEGKENEDESN